MQDLIGRTLGHYRIVEHLGGGGMGVVYKTEDTKLKRTVALKFLPPEWSRDPDARERFLREARAASALEDSRICTIHDIDETDDGQLFIAMAYYEGETLKKRLERGRLPIGEAVDIAIQVAEGLERAHSAEILHRDIKPANLMLTGHDEVVIVDFGLAKLAGEHGLTQTGAAVGTPHYMSPEQAKGAEVGPATDIWSLGVVLYEMVTGDRPFLGDSGDVVVHSILHNRPKRLRDLRSEAPPMLERVVKRALEKDVAKRYALVGDLLTDLLTLKVTEGETGVRTEAMGTTPGRRRRLVASLGLVSVVVFAVALTWVLSKQANPPVEPDHPPRIVVLPFENLGPPEDEYFADGMTEEITSRLSAVSGLHVISRTSAMHYKKTDKTIHQIGEELRVQYALEGTVRWGRTNEGNGRVRITPQLIEIAEDRHLWSDRYDRAIESVFEVQSDIAGQVVGQLHINLLGPENDALNTRPTNSPEAYAAYLNGLHYQSALNSFDQMELSIAMFERAVELDPEFALAWAALSRRLSVSYMLWLPTPEGRSAAKNAAEKALVLDPALPEAHAAMATYYYGCHRDYNQALAYCDRVLLLRPNDSGALAFRARVLRRMGRWEESTLFLEQAFEYDPVDHSLAQSLGSNYKVLRDYRKAGEYFDLAISLAPDLLDNHLGKLEMKLSQGLFEEARELLRSAPVGMRRLELTGIELEIADRRFHEALRKIEETPQAVYEQVWGEAVAGYLPDFLECTCRFFLDDQRGVQDACGRALVALEESIGQYPERWAFRSRLGQVHALLGRKEDAIREGELAVAMDSDDAVAAPGQIQRLAWIYVRVGEFDKAIDQLEYLLSNPGILTVDWLRLHPDWDPLRDHPRFQALLEE